MQNKEWDRTQQQQNENSETIKARGRKNGGWVDGWILVTTHYSTFEDWILFFHSQQSLLSKCLITMLLYLSCIKSKY